MALHPAVSAVRRAVRDVLADLDPGARLVVACSGGADSLALLAATVFAARRGGHHVSGVSVDHRLQPGSAQRAAGVAAQMGALGAHRAEVVVAEVGTTGGPEAAARSARYAALERAASAHGSAVVLLGHTRDDQAETVLLGLARGSGARSLCGMARVSAGYRRPLLDITRQQTVAACEAEGIAFWSDPHNEDPAFARVRVRRTVLPTLERELGPGIREALARTARLLRDDADALDAAAAGALAEAWTRAGESPPGLVVARLLDHPPAVRRRVLRAAALAAGCPPAELFLVHVDSLDAMVTDWHGQRGVDLPGHLRARRDGGTLHFGPGPVGG